MSLYSEIREQPQCLIKILEEQRKVVEEVADEIRNHKLRYVFLAARGTSDNAGRYANYLFGEKNGLALALATPSLFTYYHTPPRLEGSLVMCISQSGQSPDIVSVLEEGKRQGCLTLALTNDLASPLAQYADWTLDLNVGPEKAVAATKTYSSELMLLAMLSSAMNGKEKEWNELERVGKWVEQVIELEDNIKEVAQRYRYMQQCVVLGRGYNYATSFEWALKLKELTYVGAEPYSSADFLHGPIAMVNGGFPVFTVAPEGKVFPSMLETMMRLKHELDAELVVISNVKKALDLSTVGIELPGDLPEWLSPIIAIIAAQLFSYHLTKIKGYDSEMPRAIHKVTETK